MKMILWSILITLLTLFSLVYIKQNVKKQSSIIILNSLVLVVYFIVYIYILIYIFCTSTIFDVIFENSFILVLFVNLSSPGIIKTIAIFSLIYSTNNMKNLRKVLLIFLGYIGLSVFAIIMMYNLILGLSEYSLIESLKMSLKVIFSLDNLCIIINFIIYCLIISLSFKILSRKNEDILEDILIDGKNDEERENTEK